MATGHGDGMWHLQVWGPGDATKLLYRHANDSLAMLGQVAVERHGGAFCLAPIYRLTVHSEAPVALDAWQAGHDALLARLAIERQRKTLPPLRVLVDAPPLKRGSAEL